MDRTKITLSTEEAALITRADWILTKNNVIEKTKQLLAALQTDQYHFFQSRSSLFPGEIKNSSPKLSKGENYKGLPYLVLDYPRYFDRKDTFTIRTFFWWGNFFSVTLHLSGDYKKMYEEKIIRSFESLKANDFSVCINEDQWEYHFETNNFQCLQTCNASEFEEIISKKHFIKLSKKISLQQWNDAERDLLEIFSQLINTLIN